MKKNIYVLLLAVLVASCKNQNAQRIDVDRNSAIAEETPALNEELDLSSKLVIPITNFWINLHFKGFKYAVYLNGAPIYEKFSLDKENDITLPVTSVMKPGTNKLTIDFVPINFKLKNYTPNSESFLKVRLSPNRSDLYPNDIDLFWAQYDMKSGSLVPMVSYENRKPLKQSGHFHVDWKYSLSPTDMWLPNKGYSSSVETTFAQRLTINFNLPSDENFEALPWQNAPYLKDDSRLRQELMEAYDLYWDPVIHHDIHKRVATSIHILRTMASASGYSSIQEYLSDSEVKEAILPSKMEATPARWPSTLDSINLLFNDQHNMVTINPVPLKFVSSKLETSLGPTIYFFRNSDGKLVAGYQEQFQ